MFWGILGASPLLQETKISACNGVSLSYLGTGKVPHYHLIYIFCRFEHELTAVHHGQDRYSLYKRTVTCCCWTRSTLPNVSIKNVGRSSITKNEFQ